MAIKKNMVGLKIGRLLVLDQAPHRRSKSGLSRVYWLCKCDCGETTEVSAIALNSKRPTQSCGCKQIEAVTQQGHNNYKGQGLSVIHSAFIKYKWRASKKNIEFSLSEEEFSAIVYSKCYYCDANPSHVHRTELNIDGTLINGVDRIDSALGYCTNNVVACCGMCNTAKSDHSIEKFFNMVMGVYNKHLRSSVNG